ncbi:hypothetical protein [Silvibacterium dinghuense]|uniref:hypothetical protein n=1 Tax=Silvibacterium dinghuense TaxID=1560006 RepID=UPI0019B509A3|nr:hypothetical protein [Silvibacterium dinghuense]GGH00605.1 hypothetical protein GCM10011586_15230 [Silvibacterium dinghuense]
MLDVHPPHEPVLNWRDFLIHLFTITIGLLIAVGIEGCVEWREHRHLANEAAASMTDEIRSNAKDLQGVSSDIHKQQATLKEDVAMLKQVLQTGKLPHGTLSVHFSITDFDEVSWKTAQSTGALAFMPYSQAQEFSNIYNTQEELRTAEHQAARDAIVSLGTIAPMEDNKDDMSPADAKTMMTNIGILQGQLLLVDALVTDLDGEYRKYLAAHPQD